MSHKENCWPTDRIILIAAVVGVIAFLLFWLALSFGFWGGILWGIIIGVIAFLILWLNFGCAGDGSVARGGAPGAGTPSSSGTSRAGNTSGSAASASDSAASAEAGGAAAAASASGATMASSNESADSGGTADEASGDSETSDGSGSDSSSADSTGEDGSGSVVSSGNQLSGEEELAARKGDWKYDGDGGSGSAGASGAGSDDGAGSGSSDDSGSSAADASGSTGGSANDADSGDATMASGNQGPGGSDGGDDAAESQPEIYDSAPSDADDLKQIKGVGPGLEKTLNGLGIYKFAQISTWGDGEIAWVDARLKFKGRITRDDWVGQSKTLSAGGETEFSKRVDDGEVY